MQMFGLSLGGVLLRVRPADAELALEILAAPPEEEGAGEQSVDEPVPYLDEDD
jgi:hypothetical protein